MSDLKASRTIFPYIIVVYPVLKSFFVVPRDLPQNDNGTNKDYISKTIPF